MKNLFDNAVQQSVISSSAMEKETSLLVHSAMNHIIIGNPMCCGAYAQNAISAIKISHPERFEGVKDYFTFDLRYTAPFNKFLELKRLQGTAAQAAGRRSEFCGYIIMDLSSWLNHQDEEYFNIALFYLIDRNDCWKYIFLVDGQQSAAARKLVAKLLTTFYHDHITCSVKEMTVELSFTERVNHLCLDQGAVCTIPVKAMLQELLAEHFSESVISALVSEMIGHFTFHALRHTFATRALERGMDYKTLSAIRGHYSVSFTMDTYVHSMDEHKRNEMDKMDDLFGISLEISVEQQPYPVLFTVTEEGCKAFAPDFPKIQIQAGTMETALMEAKKQIQKALSQFKYPPIPTRQEDIVVPENSVLILLKTA